MSVFAKIFIVLNLVLSVLFLGIASTVLTQRADYKRQLEEKVQELQRQTDTSTKREEDFRTRNDSLVEDIKSYQASLEGLQKENDSLKGDNLKLSRRLDQQALLFNALQANFDSQKTVLDNVAKENARLNELITQEEKDLAEYKDAMERAKNQAYVAMAEVQRLQEDGLAKDQQIRDITEQLNEFKSKIEHLKAQGIDVERLAEVKVPKPLDGKVVAVNADVLLCMVNLGEKEGVEKGMVFTVYRGNSYIGQIVVDQVYPDMCSARIDPRFLKEQMREGDDVTTRIR
ncbi:MAG: hypothetical protein HY720_03305 [Planctomycetes bacterium]|nr:hypothetical protein [Planctomycetota bacterium]